jgi:polysaccharide export outer membrane protein
MEANNIIRGALLGALIVLGLPAWAGAQINNYRVGAQDVLQISVVKQDLAGKYTVEADGSFTFPYVGRVKVGGLTLREVEETLQKGLADGYFRNPQVTVAVDTFRSQQVFVMGEVRTPGAYVLAGDVTLVEVLARAGSTTEAAGTDAQILRPKNRGVASTGAEGSSPPGPESEVILVDISDLRRSQSIELMDGDTVNVLKAESLYVDGQVKTAGRYTLRKGTTVRQALTLAGGVTERGATSRIKITRVIDGKRTEASAKLDDPVLPNDIIYVPERYF